MNGYEELKREIEKKARAYRRNNIYIVRVESVDPFKISNGYFGEIFAEQIAILSNTKLALTGNITENADNHTHKIKKNDFKVGDDLLVLLYEQESEQKFIVVDKVVSYE
ncbi:DUF2577 family protein [Peptostreptococcus sp. D1]|uniref:DUF2577 family protein n=1 Tax=Peptostreptococcus sp. D1 TaxID=72304 RepID=UPI0008E9D971|nr:DUF2577 family protein [Peptostreptococcus sp. D1]SFE87690.1 Protein of unknown function [Peptostreptococcus sp. D1]